MSDIKITENYVTREKYSVTRYETYLDVSDILENYFDFEYTFSKCKKCPGYASTWACGPFDFDPREMISQFKKFHFIVDKIHNQNASDLMEAQDWMFFEKNRFDKEMRDIEAGIPESMALAAQECVACKKCARISGIPCIHPDIMRYGLEAIGCFPVKMVHDKLGFDILWSSGTDIPEYYLLVAGVFEK